MFMRPLAPQPQAAAAITPNYDELLNALSARQVQLNQVTQGLVAGQQAQSKDIVELKNQMGEVVDFMGRFTEDERLPSNAIPNPKNDEAQ